MVVNLKVSLPVGKDGTTTMGLFPLGEVVKAKIWCNVSLRLFVLHSMNVNNMYPDTTKKSLYFSLVFCTALKPNLN